MFRKDYKRCIMDYEAMGRRIKSMRIKNDFTQEQLAEMAGLSSAHISNIETAHTKVSLPALVSIANALDVSLDEIVCDSLRASAFVYSNALYSMFEECNLIEIKIISETVDALRKSLKNNDI